MWNDGDLDYWIEVAGDMFKQAEGGVEIGKLESEASST